MDAISKVNTYFPSTTWTSFTVLANLVINDAAMCTYTQYVMLWLLIGLFCLFNFLLCFTDSVQMDGVQYTVLLLPGWLVPDRLVYAWFPSQQARRRLCDSSGHEHSSLSTKAVFLPDIPDKHYHRGLCYSYYECGEGRLSIQDFLQACLTTGTFACLAVLNTAYVSCTFPAYDTRQVAESGRILISANQTLPTMGRKMLQAPFMLNSVHTKVDPTIVRAAPTIVAFFVSGILAFFKSPRQMIGYTKEGGAAVPWAQEDQPPPGDQDTRDLSDGKGSGKAAELQDPDPHDRTAKLSPKVAGHIMGHLKTSPPTQDKSSIPEAQGTVASTSLRVETLPERPVGLTAGADPPLETPEVVSQLASPAMVSPKVPENTRWSPTALGPPAGLPGKSGSSASPAATLSKAGSRRNP
eukprot:jgi/Botrbrau1/3615/Bobra.0204s0011.1